LGQLDVPAPPAGYRYVQVKAAHGCSVGLYGIQSWRAFCSGDGSGTTCPCGNAGLPGHGCASTVSTNGARLLGLGEARLTADTLVLSASEMPNSSALFFQGTNRMGGGAGVVFGDGLRCAGGTIVKLGSTTNVGGASQYPAGSSLPISTQGGIGSAGTRTYQVWYRNAAPYCTPWTFNLTNGVEVTWVM